MTAPDSRSAEAAEAAWPEDAIEVARIADAWGIKGWFKVHAHSADPQAIFATRRWYLKPAEAAIAGKGSVPGLLKILSLREHGDGLVASAEGVSDRNAAEALRGARVFVSRAHFPKADPDEFYWVDLVGLTVVNRQGETLGEVIGLIDTGPHAVLRIQPAGLAGPAKPEQERLIPFVSAFVDDVSLQERRITVDWGLDF